MPIRSSAAIILLFSCAWTLAQVPATQPSEIPLPSQFSDEDQLSVELISAAKSANETNANAALECVGTISVGGVKSDRKFNLRGRVEAGVLKGEFTDDLGNTFSFTARQDADTQFLIFQTGRTTYRLPRAQGSPGIFRMSLVPVADGLEIHNLLKDSPADRAGLHAGDVITAVDGRSAAGVDPSALSLRGFAGTEVQLTIRHTDGSVRSYSLKREPIDRRNWGGFPRPLANPGQDEGRGGSRER